MPNKTILGTVGYSAQGKTNKINALTTQLTNALKAYVDQKLADAGIQSDDIEGLQGGTLTTFTAVSELTSLRSHLLYNFTSLISASFANVTAIPQYTCYGDAALTTVVASHATTVGSYAFQNCRAINSLSLPTLTGVSDYAFNYAGANAGSAYAFSITFSSSCSVGSNAFSYSNIGSASGSVGTISSYAFANCSNLTTINLSGATYFGDYAFQNDYYVSSLTFSNAAPTYLGSYAFKSMGSRRSNKASQTFVLDFKNGTATTVGSYCFAGEGSSYKNSNMEIHLPSTVTSIQSGAFQYMENCKIFVYGTPTLSSTDVLTGSSNTYIIVDPENLDTISGMTNWNSSAVLPYVIGGGNGYAAGSTLPQYTKAGGRAITWYTEIECTNVVTTSAGADITYYCKTGTTRLVWYVNEGTLVDGSFTISDGVNTYGPGDFIPVGTTVTITPVVTDNSKNVLFSFVVNGTNYTSAGTATIQVGSDLDITVVMWDGTNLPFLPNMADNDWSMIKLASKSNAAILSSWNIGDTKEAEIDGVPYLARLVDKTGKYTRVSDGSIAHLKFELTQLLPDNETFDTINYNNTMTASKQLLAKMNSGAIWSKLPASLQSALEEVNVKVAYNGNSSTLVDLPLKVFLQREHDLFSSRSYSRQEEWDAISAQDEYYQSNNSNAARKKAKAATPTSYASYWEMSPRSGSTDYVCFVYSNGNANFGIVGNSYGVAPCFAL